MEFLLTAVISTTVFLSVGQTLQYFLARHIQRLVLAGSKFHLAQSSNGAIELRSGVRQGTLTQKEASSLAPALRTLVSKVRWNPILGLKLLSRNQGLVEAQGIEDTFLKAAVDSQRQELILLAEEHGVKGRAVELIMGVERDEDFEKLRAAIRAANYGDDLPESMAKQLQLKDRRMIEPLVLWSSKSVPSGKAVEALPQKIESGKAGVSEETIPSLPGHSIRTWLSDRNGPYEAIKVEIRKGEKVISQDSIYTDIYRGRLDSETTKVKAELISQVKTLAAMGI